MNILKDKLKGSISQPLKYVMVKGTSKLTLLVARLKILHRVEHMRCMQEGYYTRGGGGSHDSEAGGVM